MKNNLLVLSAKHDDPEDWIIIEVTEPTTFRIRIGDKSNKRFTRVMFEAPRETVNIKREKSLLKKRDADSIGNR